MSLFKKEEYTYKIKTDIFEVEGTFKVRVLTKRTVNELYRYYGIIPEDIQEFKLTKD